MNETLFPLQSINVSKEHETRQVFFFFLLKVKSLLIVSLGQTAVMVQGKLVEHHLLVHFSRWTRNW